MHYTYSAALPLLGLSLPEAKARGISTQTHDGDERKPETLGYCGDCNRYNYRSRRQAKRAARWYFPHRKRKTWKCRKWYHFTPTRPRGRHAKL